MELRPSAGAIRIAGRVALALREPRTGRVVRRIEAHNLVTDKGLQLVCQLLNSVSGWTVGLRYIALGTGTATPVAGDTTLASEQCRALCFQGSRFNESITMSAFFLAANSTFNIQEVGIFGHSTANGTANTGELFARTLVGNADNSAGYYDVSLDWEWTMKRDV